MKRVFALLAALLALLACYYLFGPMPSRPQPTKADARPTVGQADTLNLNLATQADLVRLPGIGPVTAEKILRLRSQLRGFERSEQLILVPGMSERKFNKFARLVKVE
ncbi:MAG: helix-hairpin-helix domain-containing protein [Acidobacteria bacterium]|nr:helix-hairpin-helix domain-containing protein [Acidobacteriota bacterium]